MFSFEWRHLWLKSMPRRGETYLPCLYSSSNSVYSVVRNMSTWCATCTCESLLCWGAFDSRKSFSFDNHQPTTQHDRHHHHHQQQQQPIFLRQRHEQPKPPQQGGTTTKKNNNKSDRNYNRTGENETKHNCVCVSWKAALRPHPMFPSSCCYIVFVPILTFWLFRLQMNRFAN